MANETLAPDGLLESSGLTGSLADIDEDPASNDGAWLTAPTNTATICRVSFPTPSGGLTGTQSFRLRLRKTSTNAGRTDDSWQVYLYQAGGSGTQIGSGTGLPTDPGTVLTVNWDASQVSDASVVECRVVTAPEQGGSPGARGSVEVGSIAWDVQYSTGGESFSASTTISASVITSDTAAKGGSTAAPLSASLSLPSSTVSKVGFGSLTVSAALDLASQAVKTGSVGANYGLTTAFSGSTSSEEHFSTSTTLSTAILTASDGQKAGQTAAGYIFSTSVASDSTKTGQSTADFPISATTSGLATKAAASSVPLLVDFAISATSAGGGAGETHSATTTLSFVISALSGASKGAISTSSLGFAVGETAGSQKSGQVSLSEALGLDFAGLGVKKAQRSASCGLALSISGNTGSGGGSPWWVDIDPKNVRFWPIRGKSAEAPGKLMQSLTIDRSIKAIGGT